MFFLNVSQMGNWVAKVWLKKVMTEAGEVCQVGNCFLHKVSDSVAMQVLAEVRLWWQAPPILARETSERLNLLTSQSKLGSSRFRERLNKKDNTSGNEGRHRHQSLYTCPHVCTRACTRTHNKLRNWALYLILINLNFKNGHLDFAIIKLWNNLGMWH